jgi:hypothetical protein
MEGLGVDLVERPCERLFLGERGASRRLTNEVRRPQSGLGTRNDLVPDAHQHWEKDSTCAAELAVDVAEETGRPVLGTMSRVDQRDAQQQPGRVSAALQIRDSCTRIRERFITVAAHGVRTRQDVAGMADTPWRVDPPQCVDRAPQPCDRGVELTKPALVESHVHQCQVHTPLVATGAVERRLAQRAFDRLLVLAQILVVYRLGHRQRCSLPQRRIRTNQVATRSVSPSRAPICAAKIKASTRRSVLPSER